MLDNEDAEMDKAKISTFRGLWPSGQKEEHKSKGYQSGFGLGSGRMEGGEGEKIYYFAISCNLKVDI